MLLCHQKGSTDFVNLWTINGFVHPTYRAACEALGLLEDDKEWETVLEEANATATASQIRSLFTYILVYCDVSNPYKLWKQFWLTMSDDIPLKTAASLHMQKVHINRPELEAYVLYEIEIILNRYSKLTADYGLPPIPPQLLHDCQNRLIMEEKNYDKDVLKAEKYCLLDKINEKQKYVYNAVINCASNNKQILIFVYGHGGTGKTFLWKTIITSLRSEGKIVLAVASSGIASLLLPSGQTAHSKFKLPIDLSDESICNIKKKTQMASLLLQTDLIVWDEAPMNNRRCFETLDRTLRDITDSENILFGGKSIMLGGDFRQTLPVKKRGSKEEIIDASIITSYVWPHFEVCKLTENMRLSRPVVTDAEKQLIRSFSSWLLDIGNGDIGIPDEKDPMNTSWVEIPFAYCIEDDEHGLQNLIAFIYDNQLLQNPTCTQLQQKAIVCPKNDDADTINSSILLKIDKPSTIYTSSDTARPYGNDNAWEK